MARGLAKEPLHRLDQMLDRHVADGDAGALAWHVARRGDVHQGTAGTIDGRERAVDPDTIFRLSSMTKPVTAVAALILVEECVLRLDDPVDRWLPELADRRVMRDPRGSIDDTVPADRPITVRDLLTFRTGWGMDFAEPWDQQPLLGAMAELGLGAGPPAPAATPAVDEWLRRLGTLPLARQPGTRWMYHTSAQLLGALLGRASGQPFDRFLRERIFEPLGMRDTGFSVPEDRRHRFGGVYGIDGGGQRFCYDTADGQWAAEPAFPDGGDGLVSTIVDYAAFAEMLLAGGTLHGTRILSRPTVEAMTMDHLTFDQRSGAGPDPTGAQGWGLGIGVQVVRTGPTHSVGTYGWDGGLGSSWATDPAERLVGILLTDRMWSSPAPPPLVQDFWTATYAAIAD